ncbi:hypothetical protein NDU88_003450 [Pleurodeles waltl]|uniref:Uncharacterized protein n=1 Tax=Pleurodeles waltl TaxID=8319 RepID=A0AAV7KUV3_PLEWA|nr:hypothetical protein NDU88_003450 [Pleurodeles waltl]
MKAPCPSLYSAWRALYIVAPKRPESTFAPVLIAPGSALPWDRSEPHRCNTGSLSIRKSERVRDALLQVPLGHEGKQDQSTRSLRGAPGCQALKKVPPGHFPATASVQLSPRGPRGIEEQHVNHVGCGCSWSRVKHRALTSWRRAQDPFPLTSGDSSRERFVLP